MASDMILFIDEVNSLRRKANRLDDLERELQREQENHSRTRIYLSRTQKQVFDLADELAMLQTRSTLNEF